MLSFECTLASSGGALILTVNTDSGLAGQTVTCSDGTTILSKTFPSTSPFSVEFKLSNAGTWTISSGTASENVIIPDSIEIHEIPTGATVTPTDNIQTWLHCSNIWDKAYTTISQVLADASTLQTLIASANAVDYMARSTTWASDVTADSSAMSYIGLNDYCADSLLSDSTWLNAICNSTYFESVLNVKVPTMTSNTTPSGQAFGANSHASYGSKQYQAFDGSRSTMWADADNANSSYVGYMFTSNVIVYKFVAKFNLSASISRAPKAFKIQGSNSGTSSGFSDVYSKSNNTEVVIDAMITNPSSYKYYRLLKVTGSDMANTMYVDELQFYGRASS